MTTVQQRRYEVWASNLLFLAFGLSVVTNHFLHRGYSASHYKPRDYFTLFIIAPLLLGLYYLIRTGLRGAKTFFLVVYALVLAEMLQGLPAYTFSTPLYTFDFISQQALQIGACLLLLLSLRKVTDPQNVVQEPLH